MEDFSSLIEPLLSIWDWVESRQKSSGFVPFLFSDGGYLIYPTEDITDKRDVLRQCFADASRLMDEFLRHQLFVRGAVTYGRVSWTERLLVGDAVVRAARLESSFCPGPFIIIPVKEIKELLSAEEFIAEYKVTKVPDKQKTATAQCYVVFPVEDTLYIEAVIGNAERFTTDGPWRHGRFWDETLTFLLTNFPQFEKWKRK